jgi:hypothetical protein
MPSDKVSELQCWKTPTPNLELNVNCAQIGNQLDGAPISRTIQLYESGYDVKMLDDNKWNFQIAKSVANADGTVQYNVIWQSRSVAANTFITWEAQYGMNWTQTLPDPGASVTVGGEWQACSLGQVFDIDKYGLWVPSSVPSEAGFMKVGTVNYQYPGVVGIHIVIGIQNSDGSFGTIFVDPTALTLNDSAVYQPRESLQWWYQTDTRTATMISGASTAMCTLDFTLPGPDTNKYYYSTTYNYSTGTWITSEYAPSDNLYRPPQSLDDVKLEPPQLFSLWPSTWVVILTNKVATVKQAAVLIRLGFLMRIRYEDVKVEFKNDTNIYIKLGTPKRIARHSAQAIGVPDDNIKGEISDCLQFLVDNGDFPAGQTWKFEKVKN